MSSSDIADTNDTIPQRYSGNSEDYVKLRRRLLWALPTGIYLLGSHSDSEVHVMTTSWVSQVATEPKIIMCSVESRSKTQQFILESQNFTVALIAKSKRDIIRKYVKVNQARENLNDAILIEGNRFTQTALGNPYPEDALGYLEARVLSVTELSSHKVILGEVTDCQVFGELTEILEMHDTRMNYGG